ncbi:MASE1 domain-containing protein [Lentzea tibetensis]|uniref:MASE1 domain-containing protein n=1 Tax=Lentzea tibetensis TaxID=2591470 RepID=UPI001C99DFC0|nr:MASE1 domain-containing protein [Lentzea tibetensis]
MNAGVRTALTVLAVAAAYYATAQVGLVLALVRGQVTPLWLPTGISLAALLLAGGRMWPGIALGAFCVNIGLGPNLLSVLLITAGNTLAPFVAYLLLRRVGFRIELDRLRDALALVFVGAFGGMAVSATMGVTSLKVAGALPWSEYPAAWSVWWTGDAMGVLVFAPLLLTLRHSWRIQRRRVAEAVLLLTATIGLTMFVTSTQLRLLFLVFPLLIWAALRFQHAGAAPCALIVSTIAVLTASDGYFAPNASVLTTMIVLQLFNGSIALTGLLLSAITSERNEARRAIEHACEQLADTVARYQGKDVRTSLGRVVPPT